jgi:hypothetical protein
MDRNGISWGGTKDHNSKKSREKLNYMGTSLSGFCVRLVLIKGRKFSEYQCLKYNQYAGCSCTLITPLVCRVCHKGKDDGL